MRFSPLVDRISGRGAGAWGVHAEAARRRDAGEDVIFLTVGDPDQAPPEPVIDATIDALRRHRTGYSATVGYPRVREAIAARFHRRTGQPCSAHNVVVTPGDHHALVLSPFYANVSTAPIAVFNDASLTNNNSPAAMLPKQRFEGFGTEIGYRYYVGAGGPRG